MIGSMVSRILRRNSSDRSSKSYNESEVSKAEYHSNVSRASRDNSKERASRLSSNINTKDFSGPVSIARKVWERQKAYDHLEGRKSNDTHEQKPAFQDWLKKFLDSKSNSIIPRDEDRRSLAVLQDRFHAPANNETNTVPVPTKETTTTSLTTVSLHSSLSSFFSDGTEPEPIMDLQRSEIEWKGQRYPVLIGGDGRIWEGPCLDLDCQRHNLRNLVIEY